MSNPPRHGPRNPDGPDAHGPDQDGPDPASDAARTDRTLPELLGSAGAQEEERSNLLWLAGLLAVLAFLGLVALVVSRLSPA